MRRGDEKKQMKKIKKDAKRDRDHVIAEMKALVCVYCTCNLSHGFNVYVCMCSALYFYFNYCCFCFKSTFDNYRVYKLIPKHLQGTLRSV